MISLSCITNTQWAYLAGITIKQAEDESSPLSSHTDVLYSAPMELPEKNDQSLILGF